MPQFTVKKFEASTIDVNYVEAPDNGPPMVLIHGLGSRWTSWEPIMDQFSEQWHVYAVDLRGHGDSGRVPDGYEFNDYPAEIIEFLRGVIGQPAHLVGSSLGGVTAAGICALAPALVAAAVLVDPPLYIKDWFNESNFAPRFQQSLDIRNKGLDVFGTALELRKIDGVSSDEEIAKLAITLTKTDPGVWAAAIDGQLTESWDPDAVLAAAKAPVLLMQANPDMGGALRDVETTRTIDLLKQGRHVKWDDSGHGMHSQHPERFVQLVNAFFGQLLKKS